MKARIVEVAEFSAKMVARHFRWSWIWMEPSGPVQRVIDIRVLHREDRDALMDDAARMRAFRAHIEGRRY